MRSARRRRRCRPRSSACWRPARSSRWARSPPCGSTRGSSRPPTRTSSNGSQAGTFREPLLHRLAGYSIRLPPLRERRDDIGRLLVHFLRQELAATGELEDPRPGLAPPALDEAGPGGAAGPVRLAGQCAAAPQRGPAVGDRQPWPAAAPVQPWAREPSRRRRPSGRGGGRAAGRRAGRCRSGAGQRTGRRPAEKAGGDLPGRAAGGAARPSLAPQEPRPRRWGSRGLRSTC